MTPKSHLWLSLGIVLVGIAAAIFCAGWIYERHNTAVATSIAAQKDADIAANQKLIASKDADIQARTAAGAAADAIITAQQAALAKKTPAQIVQIVHDQLPPAPAGQPATAAPQVVATSSLPAADQAALPNSPQVALVPLAMMSSIAQQQLACQKTTNDYGVCQGNLTDNGAKLAATQQQLADKTAEATAWKNAAKGGSKFHRTLTVLKYVGCAGAGGFAGSKASPQNPGTPAAFGAAAAVAACSFIP